MARTKNRPATARSAAHTAPDPAPAPGPALAPSGPPAAVHAALAANPGGTVAVIAGAAGTGKPTTRDVLLDMEKAGTATRVKGSPARHRRHLDPGRPGPGRRRPRSRPGRAGQPAI